MRAALEDSCAHSSLRRLLGREESGVGGSWPVPRPRPRSGAGSSPPPERSPVGRGPRADGPCGASRTLHACGLAHPEGGLATGSDERLRLRIRLLANPSSVLSLLVTANAAAAAARAGLEKRRRGSAPRTGLAAAAEGWVLWRLASSGFPSPLRTEFEAMGLPRQQDCWQLARPENVAGATSTPGRVGAGARAVLPGRGGVGGPCRLSWDLLVLAA